MKKKITSWIRTWDPQTCGMYFVTGPSQHDTKCFHKSILQWGRPNPTMGPAQPDQGADLGAAPVAATRAAGDNLVVKAALENGETDVIFTRVCQNKLFYFEMQIKNLNVLNIGYPIL
jgi:hypothetical protein